MVSASSSFRRYLLFQIPEWLLVGLLLLALHHYGHAPVWVLVLGGLGFVAKDVLLYPWLRHAYEKVGADPGEHLVGRAATVVEELSPEGWVRVNAELWRAVASEGRIAVGTLVRIRALRGHELVVESEPGSG